MADPHDVELTKLSRREFIKHRIDLSLADIRVSHGVIYLRGVVSKEKGAAYDDVRHEAERVTRILRHMPGVRDIVVECTYRN
ncbi:MAG: hypothetical protein SNJ74_02990 [Fimbriimonadaceae bacterium]